MSAIVTESPGPFDLRDKMAAQIGWLKQCQILRTGHPSDGAISRYPDQGWITPYFSNFAAMAMLRDPECLHRVELYLEWYLRHLEVNGTMLDYRYDESGAPQTAKPDSEDSYAATYLSLVAGYCKSSGNPGWARENRKRLKKVAGVMVNLTKMDGLTYALATHPVKYLMDNCEVYRGLRDFGDLLHSMEDPAAAYYYNKAKVVAGGIERVLWNRRHGCYHSGKTWPFFKSKTDWEKFYPDASCQVFPALYGLLDPQSPRATDLYEKFNRHQDWVHIGPPDYPWMILGYCACLHGDRERALEKVRYAGEVYLGQPSGLWFCAESAFYVLACAALTEETPAQ